MKQRQRTNRPKEGIAVSHKKDCLCQCAIALTVVIALAAPALAQQGTIRSIGRWRVKPDRLGDFQSVLKEYNAVFKKANFDKTNTFWASMSGPSEYVLVRYYTKWAELDVIQDPMLKEYGPELARLAARLNQCLESRERIVEMVLPDLSLPMSQEIPKFVHVMRTRVRPDKVDEYTALIKSVLLPAARKAGMKTYLVTRARFGAPSNEFRSVIAISGWGELDGPRGIIKALGEEAWQQYQTKRSQLVLENEINLYRFMPELSYIPGQTGSTGNE
jgi:hypothetical protein